ncbi:MAG TPA: tail fiber protein [Azospirillaceae bacterium]|nr:tail fiber protein [Azospirillaceae bacterium]
MFAGNYNPEDWILCDGQALSVQQQQALFSLIGVTYGGDGVNNFNVPDLRGRIPIGQGTNTTTNPPLSARTLGQTGGEETHTLAMGEMPAHSHTVYTVAANATSKTVGPNMVYAQVQQSGTINGLYTAAVPPAANIVQLDTKAVTYAGGGQAHANVMTTTAISFIMAILGNYPTRPN